MFKTSKVFAFLYLCIASSASAGIVRPTFSGIEAVSEIRDPNIRLVLSCFNADDGLFEFNTVLAEHLYFSYSNYWLKTRSGVSDFRSRINLGRNDKRIYIWSDLIITPLQKGTFRFDFDVGLVHSTDGEISHNVTTLYCAPYEG